MKILKIGFIFFVLFGVFANLFGMTPSQIKNACLFDYDRSFNVRMTSEEADKQVESDCQGSARKRATALGGVFSMVDFTIGETCSHTERDLKFFYTCHPDTPCTHIVQKGWYTSCSETKRKLNAAN